MLFFIWSYASCLYKLDISPLSIIAFADIFSHSVGWLFALSVISFTMQKLLNLIISHFLIFGFVLLTLGDRSNYIHMASQVLLVVKNLPANSGDISYMGLKIPGGGHGNPLQYSCLKNALDRGTWQAMACRVTMSQRWLKCLSTHTHILWFMAKSILPMLSPIFLWFLMLHLGL